ncbi:hypothetical protein DH2020_014743 [Rehmannia glutinosa]|uniref:Auxin response factor domain-containing protein n=1 Tax=Rehmannia glutinosa TaxID=99300 RepID=A0ABR0WXB7_REHGL
MVQMPPVNSKVFYFPQGHFEQCSENVDLGNCPGFPAYIPCTVSSIKFMANPETDEVFAKIRLVPIKLNTVDFDSDRAIEVNRNRDKPPAFTKTLTQSDANNGGGFSVPRVCADTIFPGLERGADSPAQTIHVRGVHGEKKLVAGDSFVFFRAGNGYLCVGIRRANSGWNWSGRGRVKVEDVIGAASLAASGKPFEAVYYPRAGTPEFCVNTSLVTAAMRVRWLPGMRFKMAFETEDWTRTSWFMGNVVSVEVLIPFVGPVRLGGFSSFMTISTCYEIVDCTFVVLEICNLDIPTPELHIYFNLSS